MLTTTVVFMAFVSGRLSMPVDDPIRVDLPVYDNPQSNNKEEAQNNGDQVISSQMFIQENYPGGTPLDNYGSNIIAQKLNNIDVFASFSGPFAPVTKLESAIQETEGFGSKALSIKENVQNVVAGLFQPKPIVDTISEEEKYGNDGDKFYSAGKSLVGGAESVSNLVNSVLEVPSAIFKKITRGVTEKLNNLGGKLIGL